MRAVQERLDKAPLDTPREGGAVVVWKLDRLRRGVKNLVGLVGEPHKFLLATGTRASRWWLLAKGVDQSSR
jgi:hypothetical protein